MVKISHDTNHKNGQHTMSWTNSFCYFAPTSAEISFCGYVWSQSEIETWYGQVFLTIPWVQWIWGSNALGTSLLWVRRIFLELQVRWCIY